MGQPRRWLPYATASAGPLLAGSGTPVGVNVFAGIDHPILNPIAGLLSAAGEIGGSWASGKIKPAVRLLAEVPGLGLSAGVDWQPGEQQADALFSFRTAIRRGGIIGHGTMVRIDWLPTRHQTVNIGVQLPLLQPFAGRTRPHQTSVRYPLRAAPTGSARAGTGGTLPSASERAIQAAEQRAALISDYESLIGRRRSPSDTLARAVLGAGSYDDLVRSYDSALASAFAAVVQDSATGVAIAAGARTHVLDDVILAYDALFGQVKSGPVIDDMFDAARDHFARWLRDSARAGAAAPGALAVFDAWRAMLERAQRTIQDRTDDSRLVWLPPQLALSPDQYDEQDEIDRLVGRVTGRSFTKGNTTAYLRAADLPLEIARSIIAARRYHVLWVHDFTGRRPSGELDQISYTMVTDAYLPALTAAVQRYDSTGVMPQYFILLDAFYYNARQGRLWMNVLEHPMTTGIPLRSSERREAEHLRERLDTLRAAVAASRRLQREAAQHGGASWIDDVVKVHVNITLPSDFSFRNSRMVPPLPYIPDNISRDHRKLALYDLTEANPDAGEVLVTGVGVGEHYASATWEDRGYRVQGPAALEARDAVRRALLENGVRPDQIPEVFRADSTARPDSTPLPNARNESRLLQVHNEPGFARKESSAARAMLYSLAPSGSVIVVPDPLWLSETWANMLAADAARGCRVFVIMPAAANNPNPEPPVVAIDRDMLQHFLAFTGQFAGVMRRSGGELRIGIYASRTPVTDARGRLAEIRNGLARAPWIRQLMPFDSSALAALDQAIAQQARTDAGSILASDETPREPQLHQKTVLIARASAIAELVRQPGWARILAQTMRTQARETARLADAIAAPLPPADTAAIREADETLQGYERSLTDAERKRMSFYFVVGSQNHDDRGLMLDGEACVIVSGFDASAGLVDLFYLMARTTWVDSEAEIDRLIPPPHGILVRLAQLIRAAM